MLVSTPAGSTAYNRSAGGSIIPVNSNLLALTPVCGFRPKHWKGSLLINTTVFDFSIHEAEKRPVSAVADHETVHNVKTVEVMLDTSINLRLLHHDQCYMKKILKEQFE